MNIIPGNLSEKVNAVLHPSDMEITHAIGVTLFILGFSRLMILIIYGISGNKEGKNAGETWGSISMMLTGAAIMLISENLMRA